MKTILQRVDSASVIVEGEVIAEIGRGLLLLTAVERGDDESAARKHAEKLAGLRVFGDGDKPYDKSVIDAGGAVLAVSNFTVAASTAKGRRPSLEPAASPGDARGLFDTFVNSLRGTGVEVATGRFGAAMKVCSVNDGPVTFVVGGGVGDVTSG